LPSSYTYNTLINALAKSGERGAAARAEHVLQIMEKRHRDGDPDFKPNTRTHTCVIDAWAKSGERGAARRAEQILNNMISRYDATGDPDIKPNVHTANAVCNVSTNEGSCAGFADVD
jgi:pentatricopeptide repeat protein